MNRGVLQSSPPIQQIIAGNPNWWNINTMRPPQYQHPPSPFLPPPFPSPSSSSSLTVPSWLEITSTANNNNNQEQIPESWSQLLLSGLVDEDKGNMMSQFEAKNNNWEEQMLHQQANSGVVSPVVDVKQENSANNFVYGGHENTNDDFHTIKPNCWSQMIPPSPAAAVSSPKSCVTSFSSNMLDFSTNKADSIGRHPPPDRSSECNSSATGGAVKKARVQPSSTPSTFKVRKEKLGDRITALHQLVSPFGKTDTASVLLEAIGYIRFLQSQIEALSLPYLGASPSSNIRHHQEPVQGERNCIFPEDPGQLWNDSCIKRKGGSDQQELNEKEGNSNYKKDLRSRGLCLVPVACTLQVGVKTEQTTGHRQRS